MRILIGTIACCLLAWSVFGQTDRGNISGIITDPAGAVVPAAPIEATNTATGAVFPAQSTDTGNYTISQLPAGTYELTVKVPGFKTFIRKGLQVEVSQTIPIDISLEVGAASDSVTITAEATL